MAVATVDVLAINVAITPGGNGFKPRESINCRVAEDALPLCGTKIGISGIGYSFAYGALLPQLVVVLSV